MLDLKGAHEWVVTTKLGSSDVRPGTTPVMTTRNCRLYGGEMAMSGFVLAAAFYGVFTVNRWTFSIFLFLQVSRNVCAEGPSLTLIKPCRSPASAIDVPPPVCA